MVRRVFLQDRLPRKVNLPDAGTVGAVVGVNLRMRDGTVVTEEMLFPSVDDSDQFTLWRLIREIPANIRALAALASNGFATRKTDGSWVTRSIVGVDGQTTVSNGDGDGGDASIGLVPVMHESGGIIRKVEFDDFGRRSKEAFAQAIDLPYDNEYSRLGANNVQGAVDRLSDALFTNRIDADGDIRVGADGSLRITK